MSKEVYQVNWNIYGSIDVEAANEEEARKIVENMSNKELEDIILEEASQGFDIGTVEKI